MTRQKPSKKQRTPQRRSPEPQGRLAAHRPPLERLLFIVALLGVLVTAHLVIWYSGGAPVQTDDPVCGVGFDCEAVIASDPAPLGVPSAVWGVLFYLAVAGVCAGIAFLGPERRLLLKKARLALIGVGFAYSAYLTAYQFLGLTDRCLLCLISAGLATTLALVQAVYLFQKHAPARARKDAPAQAAGYRLYGGLVGALLLLVVADALYFGSLEKAPAAEEVPLVTEARDIDVAATCLFDESKPVFANFEMLVDPEDPFKGNPDAPVTIIEYFDPNCPHCKTAYPILKTVAATSPEEARVVYKPVAIIGQQSVAQVAALYAAAEAGKFFEMLELQFANQQPAQGNSMEELRRFARQIGMDDAEMARQIRDGAYRDAMQRDNRIFRELGFTSVPTIIFDGHTVASRSRYVECFNYFIDQARSEAAPAADTATAPDAS